MKYIFLTIGIIAFVSGIVLISVNPDEDFLTISTMQVVFGAVFLFQFYRMVQFENKQKKNKD
jgi:hypothetical protein